MQNKCTWILFLLMIIITGCQKDEITESATNNSVNKWIYTQMKSNYLWLDELKKFSSYDVSLKPESFFNSLISSNEKKERNNKEYWYSYIESSEEETSFTKSSGNYTDQYGIEFILYAKNNTSSAYYARVLYVIPGSPADLAGLKRGMWILTIDNQPITSVNYTLLNKGKGIKLAVFSGEYSTSLQAKQIIEVGPSRCFDENPILKDTILEFPEGKVGYLAYTHFKTGPDGFQDKSYENELKDLFSKFKNANVKSFILDLRYNPGGYLTTSVLLASLLVKEEYFVNFGEFSNVFCRIKYNPKKDSQPKNFDFDTSVISYNLNLSDLVILTGGWTASASEAVINGLMPLSMMSVTLIGSKTEGKNLGSEEFVSDDKKWTLHPIVARIYNQKDESEYGNGFLPENENLFDELEYGRELGELGSLDDYPIRMAVERLGLISPSPINRVSPIRGAEEKLNYFKAYSSLEPQMTHSVWLK